MKLSTIAKLAAVAAIGFVAYRAFTAEDGGIETVEGELVPPAQLPAPEVGTDSVAE